MTRARGAALAFLLALLALALAPAAAAQSLADARLQVALEAPPGPVPPLEGVAAMAATVSVACGVSAPAAGANASVSLLVEGPAWASVAVTPRAFEVPDVSSCGADGRHVERAQVTVHAKAEAPAFRPARVKLVATLSGPGEGEIEEATAPVEADYYAILGVRPIEPDRVGAPGREERFAVLVTNDANGPTRVAFALDSVTPGWRAAIPSPILLAERQRGGNHSRETVEVRLTPPDGGATEKADGTLVVRVSWSYAGTREAGGEDEARVTFVLRSRGALVGGEPLDVPAPGAAAALAFLGLTGAVARARRAARRR